MKVKLKLTIGETEIDLGIVNAPIETYMEDIPHPTEHDKEDAFHDWLVDHVEWDEVK